MRGKEPNSSTPVLSTEYALYPIEDSSSDAEGGTEDKLKSLKVAAKIIIDDNMISRLFLRYFCTNFIYESFLRMFKIPILGTLLLGESVAPPISENFPLFFMYHS